MPGQAEYSEHHLSAFDGLRLYFRLYGGDRKAPFAVLCLAGLSRNSKDYHRLATRLAGRYPVICPDYRGIGRSGRASHWRGYSPRANLDDIRHLLATQNRHRVVVIGTSYGGLLAAAMAVAQPTVLAGAVLNDIGPDFNGGALTQVMEHVGRPRAYDDWTAAAAYLRATFPDMPADSEEDWLRIARNTFTEQDGKLVGDWDPAIVRPLPILMRDTPDAWPLFRALRRVPVLALRGESSQILSAATFARMAAEIPTVTAVTVAGVGHAPDLADPALAGRIETFLDELADGSRAQPIR